jgi:hypothetical protein
MTAVLISSELLLASRVMDAAARAGEDLLRIEDPAQLPPAESVRLLLVDWAARQPTWSDVLSRWRASAPAEGPRVILFGPHADLDAHAAARAAGLGPMWARSKLVAEFPSLFGPNLPYRRDG